MEGRTRIDCDNKILILGDSPISCLTAIRSLGEREIPIDLLTFESTTLCAKSKYINNVYVVNEFENWNKSWKSDLRRILIDNQYDMIIPTVDKYFSPLWENQACTGSMLGASVMSIFRYTERWWGE